MSLKRSCLVTGVVLTATTVIGAALPSAASSARPATVRTAAASSRTLPTKDKFYRYTGNKPLAKYPRGHILKRRVVQVSVGSDTSPVQADQLLYRTKDELGHAAVTVTTVLRPSEEAAVPRIVGYLSFYDALGSECDPSYTLAGGYAGTSSNEQQAQEEEGLIGSFLSQGYDVTVPDFEGTKLHWIAGHESGWSTLDALRATETDLKLPASTPVGLSGYSGGSVAAEWASELAPSYAPKLDLVGVAEGGIPVDLAHNLRYVNGSVDWAGAIPAVLVSLTRAYHVKPAKYLSKKGRRIAKQVHDECIGSFVGGYKHLKIQSLLKHKYRNFLAIPTFARIINSLVMGTVKGHPKAPLFIGVGRSSDGKGDGVMVTKDVEALAHEYCKQGVSVDFSIYDNSDHTQAGAMFELASPSFLQGVFGGTPPTNNCSSVGKGNSLKPLPVHHKKHHKDANHSSS